MAEDPSFDSDWRAWILTVRRQIGLVDLADLIYVRSALYRRKQRVAVDEKAYPILFGEKEGRIAAANRRKDPLLLFSAMQRQLAYPAVPRTEPVDATSQLLPQVMRRMERLETRMKLLEEDQRGGFDLSKFYGGKSPISFDLPE